jgi:hypothetical protein
MTPVSVMAIQQQDLLYSKDVDNLEKVDVVGGKVMDVKHYISEMNVIQMSQFRVLPRHAPPGHPDHC